MNSPPPGVPVTLKWAKNIYTDQLSIRPGSTADDFKRDVQFLTGVPTERQKLLCKGAWRGTLQDGAVFSDDLSPPSGKKAVLTVTLVGSAGGPPPEPLRERTRFVEDLTPEEVAAEAAAAEAMALEAAEGDIVALQKIPVERRDDEGRKETYQYSRLVSGLPQRAIEDALRRRRSRAAGGGGALLGEVAMTMGLELRRAYVNALAVLRDGTLASGLDDGHVQLWRRGELVRDTVHEGWPGGAGGVDCMASFSAPPSAVRRLAFATGGRGCVRVWTDEIDCVGAFTSPMGTSPSCLVAAQVGRRGDENGLTCLGACFRVTRRSDPNRFRLVPQDEAGRRRRAMAEAQEAAIQESLSRASRCVQVWLATTGDGLRSMVLEPAESTRTAPVSALAMITAAERADVTMVCGDEWGGLNLWKGQVRNNSEEVPWQQSNTLQIQPPEHNCSVVCMEPLLDQCLAVSTKSASSLGDRRDVSGAIRLGVSKGDAVFVVDLESSTVKLVLDAHQDTVQCMCSLPDGGLLTGGGKLDATVRVWEPSLLTGHKDNNDQTHTSSATECVIRDAPKLEDPGYVFALAVLPDAKLGSQLFAVAAARYNVVKIVL